MTDTQRNKLSHVNSTERSTISSHFHLFGKKQLTERNCTIKLENWLKYHNSSNIQLQIKLQVQIELTVGVNDLLRMLTGERSIVYRLGWHF